MLEALGCRGPDSAGVALYGEPQDGWVLQIKLPDEAREAAAALVRQSAGQLGSVREVRATGPYLRLVVADEGLNVRETWIDGRCQ